MREQLSAQPGTQRDAQPDESAPQRVLVLVVPDWPALAAALEADAPPTAPVAVLHANRVVSVNAPARALGVEPAMTTRAARGRCPDLFLAPRNPDAEARLFAAATQALDDTVARFTVLGPGAVSIPAASLRHTHPDEAAAVEHLLAALTESTGWEFLPGIADTHFAALLAARTATRVAPGSTRAFLAAQPTRAFDAALLLDETLDPQALSELVSVLERLGLRTLGAFAQLSPTDVGTRFGPLGLRLRDLARGVGQRGLRDHSRTDDLVVEAPLEPPTPRTDVLAFRARAAAAQLFDEVRRRALACTQVTIRLTAAGGQVSERTWRLEDMTDNRVADRARWQAEGWLTSRTAPRPTATSDQATTADPSTTSDPTTTSDEGDEGIALLTLTAAELAAPLVTQRSLLDRGSGAVAHSLERVQGLFGPDSVLVPGLQGGRDPQETNLWTPWQQAPRPDRDPEAPWPGAIPAPHPARILSTPVELLDATGGSVVARSSGLDSRPVTLKIPGAGTHRILDHSSPWPVETGWWEPALRQRRVRLQVLAEDGSAFLLCREDGQWRLVGEYA
jgi:protein ImuB